MFLIERIWRVSFVMLQYMLYVQLLYFNQTYIDHKLMVNGIANQIKGS